MLEPLTIHELKEISSAEGVTQLFRRLGYDASLQPLAKEDLELSESSTSKIQKTYFITEYSSQGESLQALLFELNSHDFSSYVVVRNRMDMIAGQLCKRPNNFLLIATTDYRQLLFLSPKASLNEQFNLVVKSEYLAVSLSDPSIQDCKWLEKLSVDNLSSDTLHSSHQVVLKNASIIQKASAKGKSQLDSIGAYLHEIGRIPLLDPIEEIELTRKVKRYQQLARIRSQLAIELGRQPTNREWAAATEIPLLAFQIGRRAKERLINANLRLVVSIAKYYSNRGVEFQDLIQEGNLGLIRATEKFEPELGNRFSTYATWWIKQAISRCIYNQSRTIRLPVHLYEKYAEIKQSYRKLVKNIKRIPTLAETASYVDAEITEISLLVSRFRQIASLDITIDSDNTSTLGDLIECSRMSPSEKIEQRLIAEYVNSMLQSTLKEREIYILKQRFGFDTDEPRSLESIGQELNLTRERVRQIEAKALQKLRTHQNDLSIQCTTTLPSAKSLLMVPENVSNPRSNEHEFRERYLDYRKNFNTHKLSQIVQIE